MQVEPVGGGRLGKALGNPALSCTDKTDATPSCSGQLIPDLSLDEMPGPAAAILYHERMALKSLKSISVYLPADFLLWEKTAPVC